MLEVARAARAMPPPKQPPRPVDLLLDGFALLVTDGPAAAASALQQAASAFASADLPLKEGLQFGWMASGAANALWDTDSHRAILVQQVRLTRAAGALEQLPFALVSLAMADAWRGDLAGADSLLAEADAVCDATGGGRMARYTALLVAALRGKQAEVAPLLEEAISEAEAEGQGGNAAYAHWNAAILHNGLGRYADALAAAEQATQDAHVYISMWALPDLIEAAVRTGNVQVAAGALERLAKTTQAGGTDFGLGLESRCRALVRKGETVEDCYREAVDRLDRARMAPDLARAHLLYGEWLRRQGRRADAREQLRTAHDLLTAIGMGAFAERARRELRATGETVRKRSAGTREELTPQEEQIARLARGGLSNPEIGAQLFLSARTVEWHLRKVFTKLGISSRRQLRAALAQPGRTDLPA
jgi:ATP/maltotriose-dependent transcriptional regulator MalT